MSEVREALRQLLKAKSYKEGDFTLASGKKSKFYIDVRLSSWDVHGNDLIGKVLYELIQELPYQVNAIGGRTMGSDPLVLAIGREAHSHGKTYHLFTVRKEAKSHGNTQLIVGNVQDGDHVLLIEDTTTTGSSILSAVEAIKNERKVIIEAVYSLVDREEGAFDYAKSLGIPFYSAFTIKDLQY